MTILVVGKFDKESLGSNISDGLQALGHTTILFTKGITYWHFEIPILNRVNMIKLTLYELGQKIPGVKKIEFIKLKNLLFKNKKKIDLSIVTHDFLTPNEVDYLKQTTKSPVVMWFPDAIVNFGKAMFLCSNYDALFFKDPYIVHTLRREIKKQIHYLPECCNPVVHKVYPYNETERKKYSCNITTIGNLYSNRLELFKQLHNYNFSIKIWGMIQK